VEVAVDAIEVDEIELFERFAFTLLCTVDELADVLRRLAGGTLLGCFGAHAFALPR
jgi:hypothetical protein